MCVCVRAYVCTEYTCTVLCVYCTYVSTYICSVSLYMIYVWMYVVCTYVCTVCTQYTCTVLCVYTLCIICVVYPYTYMLHIHVCSMYVQCVQYVQSTLEHMYSILCHSMCVVYPLYHGRIVDMPTCGVKPFLINLPVDYVYTKPFIHPTSGIVHAL